ncbi:hypothetical protein A1F94_009283 [Pyrenophora tritici-repentis]|uniref:Herpes-BLLF1 multi-domain protein n=1 Tax=Pyrenophora tritici-repentis TaxID=45151 RepID=A0A2W1EFC5_9PLEO|nr:hypothetical protein PtrV1_12409 [Pyrenophora tritici-repentis]KAF7445213.1 hypothetical protein A1F99_101990 [Pyrenophora tritici-repentis]KAF7565479.1 Herpes-BLLF1 multi-domain protein [Pyrenophora tritici-repentis]KAG9380388.1 hypothetical protein A1F94_009283 [Pyrenophora tritici-repentis]KAI0584695.1 hypothetical protein Alg215_02932 [Pyrenophora tritici-repentis]
MPALDVGVTLVLDSLVAEGMGELSEAGDVAEVSAGLDDAGAPELDSLVTEVIGELSDADGVVVVSTGIPALDVGMTSVLDSLVTEGMGELSEADGVAEVSAGLDEGASELDSLVTEGMGKLSEGDGVMEVETGMPALEVEEISVLDSLVAEGKGELSEADGMAEVSPGLDDEGASELAEGVSVPVSLAAEDVTGMDSVPVVAISELEELPDGTGVSEDVTDSLSDVPEGDDDVSEGKTRVVLGKTGFEAEDSSVGMAELLDTSDAVEDAVSLEMVPVDGA